MADGDASGMEFALQAPVPATEAGSLAAEAERLGFARFLVPDHPGRTSDPFVALAVAAASTSTIGLGTYVLNAGIREPWQVATAAVTLDQISGGRLCLGVSAGHTPSEWQFLGVERPDGSSRVGRLEEFVEVLGALLSGDEVTFHGQYFRVDGAQLESAVGGRRIPLIIGGDGRRVLRLAGRCAAIVSVTGLGRTLEDGHSHEVRWSPAEVKERMREVAKGASGRETPPKVEVLVQHLELTDHRTAAARRLIEDAPGLSLDSALNTPFALFGTPQDIACQMRRWRD